MAQKSLNNTALLDHFQYFYDSLDDGNFVFSIFPIFLDFRKAMVAWTIKIFSQNYNIMDFLSLIKSYLSLVNGVCSDYNIITHRVPQVSNLGPLLFLIFINDLLNSSSLFKYLLFADNSTLSTCLPKKINDIPQYTDMINSELDEVNKWILSNIIFINAEKTKFIFI